MRDTVHEYHSCSHNHNNSVFFLPLENFSATRNRRATVTSPKWRKFQWIGSGFFPSLNGKNENIIKKGLGWSEEKLHNAGRVYWWLLLKIYWFAHCPNLHVPAWIHAYWPEAQFCAWGRLRGLILHRGKDGDCLHALWSLPWCPWKVPVEIKIFSLPRKKNASVPLPL